MATVTKDSLELLTTASLENAKSLVTEAELLLRHAHAARAYFLSVAAIEEIGKALISFEGQGRNLRDSSVQSKLQRSITDHKSKIIAAFLGSLKTTEPSNMEGAIEAALELMTGLRGGREPSMYTELLENGQIQSPSKLVRDIAARDAIRLAKHCLARAETYMSGTTPTVRSKADDFVYTMKKSTHDAIMNSSDFWWYHVDQIKRGSPELSDNILSYHNDYHAKSKAFKS